MKILIPVVYFIFPQNRLGIHTFPSLLVIFWFLCVMSNSLVNALVHLLEDLSFWLRCPSFLLSKVASQLKLFNLRWGSKYLESVSQVQFSESCSQDSESQGCNFQVSGTHFQGRGCQGPVSQGLESQNPGSQGPRIPGLRYWF